MAEDLEEREEVARTAIDSTTRSKCKEIRLHTKERQELQMTAIETVETTKIREINSVSRTAINKEPSNLLQKLQNFKILKISENIGK